MTVLLTGATSFLGQHIVSAARARNMHVTALGRTDADLGTAKGRDTLLRYLDTHDAVIHAAQPNDEDAARETIKTLVRGARPVIFVSSVAVYGQTLYGAPIPETQETKPVTANGQLKLISEHLLRNSACPHLILRLPQITGSGVKKYTPGVIRSKLRDGQPVTLYHGGRVALDFVEARDIAAAILTMLEKNARGVVNMGSGTACTLLDFTRLLKNALHSTSEIVLSSEKNGVDWAVMNVDHLNTSYGIHIPSCIESIIRHLVNDHDETP